jgi:hypothetical protein
MKELDKFCCFTRSIQLVHRDCAGGSFFPGDGGSAIGTAHRSFKNNWTQRRFPSSILSSRSGRRAIVDRHWRGLCTWFSRKNEEEVDLANSAFRMEGWQRPDDRGAVLTLTQ